MNSSQLKTVRLDQLVELTRKHMNRRNNLLIKDFNMKLQ